MAAASQPSVEELPVACGAERGVFELKRFGPGGGSRCIRFETSTGVHYITPIEFEALAGKERDWKRNVRVAETNKNIREAIFGAGLVETCPKGCSCVNCGIAKKYPNNLERLIDTVYSPTKREAIRSGLPAQSKGSKKEASIPPIPGAATPSPPLAELDIPDTDSPVSSPVSVCKLSPPMDEFYTSPEKPSPRAASPPSNDKTPARTGSLQSQSKMLPDLVPLFEVAAGVYEEVREASVEHIVDEMEPCVKATPELKTKKQKDIRSFFDSPTASPKPRIMSPSPEVMLVDAPKRDTSLVDLTHSMDAVVQKKKSPIKKKGKPLTLPRKRKRSENPEQNSSSSSSSSSSSRKRSGNPEQNEESEIQFKRSARGVRMPDRVDVVKEKHSLNRKSSLSVTEIKTLVEKEGEDDGVKEEDKTERGAVKREKQFKRQLDMSSEQSDAEEEELVPRQLRIREVKEVATENKDKDKTLLQMLPIKTNEEPPRKRHKSEMSAKIESNPEKKPRKAMEETVLKITPKKEEKLKKKKNETEPIVIMYDKAIKIKKEKGEATKTSPVKQKPGVSPGASSPNKLPTYATMIKQALQEMNVVGGEGCTKLEILLYILRRFHPKGNISIITGKLVKVLEMGTKQGEFMSSVSLPRKMVKKSVNSELKKEAGVKVKKAKVQVVDGQKVKKKKVKKTILDKNGKPVKVKKAKNNDKAPKKERAPVIQSPKKLKEPLATICKAKKLSRYEVLKKIWTYIRVKKLQDPKDKTVIICDDNFRKLTKLKQISTKSVMGYLKPFMEDS